MELGRRGPAPTRLGSIARFSASPRGYCDNIYIFPEPLRLWSISRVYFQSDVRCETTDFASRM
jgi:hypothetical protein